MDKIEIPIMYGLPIGPIVGYEEDREILFPNCDDKILGGCCVDDDSKPFELKYVCKLCNETREDWKQKHNSEIFFHLQRNIKENVIIIMNNDEQLLFTKNNEHDNYWVKIIAVANGKYNIAAKNKITQVIISSINIELNNEILDLRLEKNNDKIIFRIEYKHELRALWY